MNSPPPPPPPSSSPPSQSTPRSSPRSSSRKSGAGASGGDRGSSAIIGSPPVPQYHHQQQYNEPVDTAAANAEAARLARELGVASSVRQSSSSTTGSSRNNKWPFPRRGGNNNNNNTATSSVASSSFSYARMNDADLLGSGVVGISSSATTAGNVGDSGSQSGILTTGGCGGDSSLESRNTNATTTTSSSYAFNLMQQSSPAVAAVALDPDTCPSYNVPILPHSMASFGASERQQQIHQQRVEGASYHQDDQFGNAAIIDHLSDPFPHHQLNQNPRNEPIHLYDSHGQRAPYREGPYFIAREKDGSVIRKRWYGRLEDGYLAWSSIYLHEYFRFEIYTPLTPAQEQELKKPGGQVPRWIYEFTSLPNLAIPMSYFCIGVALQLLRTPLIVYFIADLGATAAEVNVLFTVMAVPWCFKVIYGFLSDCVPISGLRRKPYFMTGWLVYIGSNLILMITPFPSIQLCIMLVFLQTAGYMLADVMTDALIVERSRFESEETRGTMQSTGYIIRFFGSTIGAAIGAVVYNKDDWNWYLPIRLVFFINAAFPMIFLVPFVPYLLELDNNCVPKNFYKQCMDLFETAQLRAVWQPMTFVYIYNALQLTNAAWMNFLVQGLDFSAWEIGLVSIVGSIMAWFGIMTYKKFFFASNWRIVYFWCTTLASVIALGQLILVFGLNRDWGIPDIWFSMGDDVLVEFVIAVQFLPMCIMYLGLCPPGSEGTTYAMLTTWSNLAGSLAFDISTALTVVWDVSSPTIAAGDYSGVWKLSLLCGIIGPVPLILLGLIPRNKEDQRKLQQDKHKSYKAGMAFIGVMILTLTVTFVESVYEVYFNDEGDQERLESQRRRLSRLLVGH